LSSRKESAVSMTAPSCHQAKQWKWKNSATTLQTCRFFVSEAHFRGLFLFACSSSTGVPELGYMYPEWYICLCEGVHLMLTIEGKNVYTVHNSCQIICTYEFVRTVHVTNGVRQGRVLSPYLLTVFLMIYFLN